MSWEHPERSGDDRRKEHKARREPATMFGVLADLFRAEVKSHPHLMFVAVLFAASIIGYSYSVFAQQVDVDARFDKFEERLCGLEGTIDQRYTEGALHALEAEIFGLERIANAGDATPRDMQRLDKLRSDLGDVQRELADLNRRHPCRQP